MPKPNVGEMDGPIIHRVAKEEENHIVFGFGVRLTRSDSSNNALPRRRSSEITDGLNFGDHHKTFNDKRERGGV